MLKREIITVCFQIHTKHINTLCGQNVRVELLNVKLASPGLQKSKQHYSNTDFFPFRPVQPHTALTHSCDPISSLYCSSGGLQTSRITEGFFHDTTIDAGVLCLRVWVRVERPAFCWFHVPSPSQTSYCGPPMLSNTHG
jgi:hypothetical protein